MPYTIVISPSQPKSNTNSAIMTVLKATFDNWNKADLGHSSSATAKTSLTDSSFTSTTITLSESVTSPFITDLRVSITNPNNDGSGKAEQSISISGSMPTLTNGDSSLISAFTALRKWGLAVNHDSTGSDSTSRFVQIIYYYQGSGSKLVQTRVYASNYVNVSGYYENIQPGSQNSFSITLTVNSTQGGMLILTTADDVSSV